LEALLGQPVHSVPPSNADVVIENGKANVQPGSKTHDPGPLWVNIYELDRNPFQPRTTFDERELQTLSESLAEHGMLQPIVVRRWNDRYQIISGERRWRAATAAGWEQVPCHGWEADDRKMAELALVENVQRKDLNPLEKAASFQKYLEQYQCTQEELARRVKIDRSTVANLIRLLELPEAVQAALRGGLITQGHARALLPLGEEREQIEFCERIQKEGLSVRVTEELVQTLIREADAEPLAAPGGAPASRSLKTRSEHLASLEQEFRAALGTKVDLRQGARGKGRIVIHFNTHREFERLHKLLAETNEPARQAG
jgi:ParB family chromosome partitioning protein